MQTNGTAGAIQPNIKAMREAVERLELENPYPLGEYRIHPDDYEDLKRLSSPGYSTSILGMKIVIDESVERLPRRGGNDAPLV